MEIGCQPGSRATCSDPWCSGQLHLSRHDWFFQRRPDVAKSNSTAHLSTTALFGSLMSLPPRDWEKLFVQPVTGDRKIGRTDVELAWPFAFRDALPINAYIIICLLAQELAPLYFLGSSPTGHLALLELLRSDHGIHVERYEHERQCKNGWLTKDKTVKAT